MAVSMMEIPLCWSAAGSTQPQVFPGHLTVSVRFVRFVGPCRLDQNTKLRGKGVLLLKQYSGISNHVIDNRDET